MLAGFRRNRRGRRRRQRAFFSRKRQGRACARAISCAGAVAWMRLRPVAAAERSRILATRPQSATETLDRATVETVRAPLTKEVAAFHLEQPGEAGMPRETLRAKWRPASRPISSSSAHGPCGGQRAPAAIGSRSRPFNPGSQPTSTGSGTAIDTRLRTAGLAPPRRRGTLRRTRRVRRGHGPTSFREWSATRSDPRWRDGISCRRHCPRLKADVIRLRSGQAAERASRFDVASFKTKYGLSRKHAIPLLEWLDRERVTRRVGDLRVVL